MSNYPVGKSAEDYCRSNFIAVQMPPNLVLSEADLDFFAFDCGHKTEFFFNTLFIQTMGHDHKSGKFNSELIIEVGIWNRQNDNSGAIYDCDTAIRLKNGSYAEPDGCWLSYLKADLETQMAWHKKLQVTPNFIWELLSEPSDLKKELNKLKDVWQAQDDFEFGIVIDAFAKKYHVADHQKEIVTKDFSEILTIPCMDNLEIDLEKLYQIAYKRK